MRHNSLVTARRRARPSGPRNLDPRWSPAARRLLLQHGYSPIPLRGKIPALDNWQHLAATETDIAAWETTLPDARNTGILTARAPAVDIDVLDEEMADAVQDVAESLIPASAPKAVRVGRWPKRAVLFRAEQPFTKLTTGKWVSEDAREHAVEVLCNGQQIVVFGTHPETREPYSWGEREAPRPWNTPWASLPVLTEDGARKLIEAAKALFTERGWRPKQEDRPKEQPKPRPLSQSDGEAHRIAVALAGRIEALCRTLLPEGRRQGAEWCVGSVNGEAGQSLRVHLTGEKAGVWCDFAEDIERGDALDLVEAARNCSTVDALDWAQAWLGEPARKPPRKNGSDGANGGAHQKREAPADGAELVMLKGSDIKIKPVQWLWAERIAIGKLSLIAGEPGLAKSQAALWLAAAVTTGGPLPSGGMAPLGHVIILSAEDTPEDTIAPRLKASGADLGRIHIISMVRETRAGIFGYRSFDLQLDLPALEKAIVGLGDARLIIIDPIASYMGKRVDSHKNAEVRAVLEPVATFAAKHGVAVLGVTHFSKGAGPTAINKFIGSIAFIAAARSAFVVTRDPDSEDEDRRLFLPVKNNLARLGNGLAFRVEQVMIEQDGATVVASHIRWLDETIEQSADAVLAALAERQDTAMSKAADFLREYLASGRKRVTEIREAARGHGHAWRTVERAKHDLGVVSVNVPEASSDGKAPPKPCWYWQLPTGGEHA
jgi:putative DNA primase/helicase